MYCKHQITRTALMEAFSIHFEYLEPMMVVQACNCTPEATKRTRRTIGAKRLVLGIILAPITIWSKLWGSQMSDRYWRMGFSSSSCFADGFTSAAAGGGEEEGGGGKGGGVEGQAASRGSADQAHRLKTGPFHPLDSLWSSKFSWFRSCNTSFWDTEIHPKWTLR